MHCNSIFQTKRLIVSKNDEKYTFGLESNRTVLTHMFNCCVCVEILNTQSQTVQWDRDYYAQLKYFKLSLLKQIWQEMKSPEKNTITF